MGLLLGLLVFTTLLLWRVPDISFRVGCFKSFLCGDVSCNMFKWRLSMLLLNYYRRWKLMGLIDFWSLFNILKRKRRGMKSFLCTMKTKRLNHKACCIWSVFEVAGYKEKSDLRAFRRKWCGRGWRALRDKISWKLLKADPQYFCLSH